jgi:hypothetical protein
VCYTGAPSGEALQRIENGAAAEFAATDVRSLALDRQASSLRATVYAITGDDPAQIWSFDGVTGLSAFESTQTFPAGATVQHILGSRQADLIYTADFDSVGAGQGALRKYLIHADQLLLWKELASGEQGHMLGLGARGATTAALVLLPSGATGAADRLFRYDGGVWTRRTARIRPSGAPMTAARPGRSARCRPRVPTAARTIRGRSRARSGARATARSGTAAGSICRMG